MVSAVSRGREGLVEAFGGPETRILGETFSVQAPIRHGGQWEIRVQLCADLDTMPVEDASVLWPEDRSPYIPVGRITVEPQEAWSDGKAAAIDEGLSFSPWHGLAAHQPLGVVMRLRRTAYAASAAFRAARNGHSNEEPKTLDAIPV